VIAQASKAIVFVILILATGQAHSWLPPQELGELSEEFVPRPAVAKLAALGFDSALADYYWLRAVQIVGGSNGNLTDKATVVGQMVDVVTTLDPWVDHPYRFAAIWLTETPQDVRKANELLRRGIEYHPDEWRNYFYLGFNHYFYFGENAEAAEVLEKAAKLDGSPAYLKRLVARLQSHASDLETSATFLMELANSAPDEVTRNGYLDALDEIEIERRARFLDGARESYKTRYGKDITRIEDLTQGATPMLVLLPSPVPKSVPAELRRDARWELSEKDGRIFSSYYKHRYELIFNQRDKKTREEWAAYEAKGEAGS
jgi:ferritin-like protein